MKKAINSKKNKYKIHVHPSFCKLKCHSHRQDYDPISSFKKEAYLESEERCGTITKKKGHVPGFSFHKMKRNEREKTTSLRAFTASQEPFLQRKKSESILQSREKTSRPTFCRAKCIKETTLHKREDISLLNGPFSQREKKVPPQLLQLAGFSSHFGRKLRDVDFPFPWHASMCGKFSGIRNKVPHISGEQTLRSLVEAFYCIALVLRKGGKVLVINQNSEFSPLFHTNSLDAKLRFPNKNRFLEKNLKNTGLPFYSSMRTFCRAKCIREKTSIVGKEISPVIPVDTTCLQSKQTIPTQYENLRRGYAEYRSKCRPATAPFKWVGGCLTNWKEISKSVATLLYFSKRFGRFIKQNNIHFPRFKKMRTSFQGFIDVEKEELLLKAPPQLLFLFNAHESQQILQEAIALQVPVVALTDSSTDLSQITYPIPINSDSAPLIHRCLSQLMQMTDRQGGFPK